MSAGPVQQGRVAFAGGREGAGAEQGTQHRDHFGHVDVVVGVHTEDDLFVGEGRTSSGVVADRTRADLEADRPRQLAELRDRLHQALADALPGGVQVDGHPDQRLPNTLNISITGVSGSDLLAAVPDVAASTGSACHAGTTEPSPGLSALGLDRDRALAALRLSLGRWSTVGDVDRAADLLTAAARRLRPAAAGTPVTA